MLDVFESKLRTVMNVLIYTSFSEKSINKIVLYHGFVGCKPNQGSGDSQQGVYSHTLLHSPQILPPLHIISASCSTLFFILLWYVTPELPSYK